MLFNIGIVNCHSRPTHQDDDCRPIEVTFVAHIADQQQRQTRDVDDGEDWQPRADKATVEIHEEQWKTQHYRRSRAPTQLIVHMIVADDTEEGGREASGRHFDEDG